MKLYFALAVVIAALCYVEVSGVGRVGICVERCNPKGQDCPQGYSCQSNGCGHVCAKTKLSGVGRVGICVERCNPKGQDCPQGFSCQRNGCGHVCVKTNGGFPFKSVDLKVSGAGRVGICVERCNPKGQDCPQGYSCQSNGCGHVCAKTKLSGAGGVGICVEMCNTKRQDCPRGYSCQSNGCGHVCVKTKSVGFGPCIELCNLNGLGCPEDYTCVSNGCGHHCAKPEPTKCNPFVCGRRCDNGYYKDPEGCLHCKCN